MPRDRGPFRVGERVLVPHTDKFYVAKVPLVFSCKTLWQRRYSNLLHLPCMLSAGAEGREATGWHLVLPASLQRLEQGTAWHHQCMMCPSIANFSILPLKEYPHESLLFCTTEVG